VAPDLSTNSIASSANAPTKGRARQEDFSGFAFNSGAQAAAGAKKKMHHSNAAAISVSLISIYQSSQMWVRDVPQSQPRGMLASSNADIPK
jgi:hypothetical protein